MSMEMLLELFATIAGLVCFAVAVRAVIKLVRVNRYARRPPEAEDMPGTEEEKPLGRAS